jgi:L-fuculose-phosphate aldolase
MNELQLRAEMCEVGRWLWNRGLIGACEGNLSIRLSDKEILCTPAGSNKGSLKPVDMVVVDRKGELLRGNGKPSSELELHLECYDSRPDCMACVHAHPTFASAMALVGETIPDNYVPEAAVVLGSVALAPFAMPGTTAMRDSVRDLLPDHKTFLLANHGALTLGTTVHDAYYRMETLERICHVWHQAHAIGQPRPLPSDAFSYLLDNALSGKLGAGS